MRLKRESKFPPPLNQGPRAGTTWVAVLSEQALAMKKTVMGAQLLDGRRIPEGTACHVRALCAEPRATRPSGGRTA